MSGVSLLPLLLNMDKRRVVVFGGGEVGHRKASLFSKYCHVDVVSRSFVPELKALEGAGGAVQLVVVYELDEQGIERHVKGASLVVAATDDDVLNMRIAELAHVHGALVNSVHDVLDVVVPSIIELEGAVVAISTRGASPAMSKFLRLKLEEAIESAVPSQLPLMVRLQQELRELLKAEVSDQHERARLLWSVLENDGVWEGLASSYEQGFKRALAYVELQVKEGDG